MKSIQFKARIISGGVFLLLLAGGGLLLLLFNSDETVETEQSIAESIQLPVTLTPTETVETVNNATATSEEATEEPTSPEVEETSPTTAPTLTPSSAPVILLEAQPTSTFVLIEWTEAEKNALSWMCNDEIGGMGTNVVRNACLSVISTVRARYAYPNGFTEKDVIGTLLRPNQFSIEVKTETPNERFYPIVEAYQQGARGSCNGYLFFDSVPGGPSVCVIYGAAGMFMEFHTGW